MLTLQFIPYGEIGSLKPEERLRKLLHLVKEDKIILLEGKLKSTEKSELISKTMAEISSKFKGIEIEELDMEKRNKQLLEKLKGLFINFLLGNRLGLTIIGPANIIKEIKKDPEKIQLLTTMDDGKKKRK
ncbi:DUF2073 domain-containing protein [Candidatus Woesearchaeota archaeon]|nr:DUF2073 domain-containing protein [Candidatus Woesearchaeota archaeon]